MAEMDFDDRTEQATQILRDVLEAMRRADVPDALEVAAFERLFDWRTANSAQEPPTSVTRESGNVLATTSSTGSDAVAKIASKLGVEEQRVGRVFHDEGDRIDLILSPRSLPRSKAAAARVIALLVAAGNQAAQAEERTPVESIRAICEDYKVYDSANFASSLKSMRTEIRVEGKRKDAFLIVTRPGWETAAELVEQLGGIVD